MILDTLCILIEIDCKDLQRELKILAEAIKRFYEQV
jgi:hypothetical protein